jgi:hypothetical protein
MHNSIYESRKSQNNIQFETMEVVVRRFLKLVLFIDRTKGT